MKHSRFFLISLAALAILSASGTKANASSVSAIYDPFSNTNLYLVGSSSSTWTQAQAQAQAIGGNLVTIHSAAEDTFVANSFFTNFASQGGPNLSNAIALWIGLYDPRGLVTDDAGSQHTANFTWVDGESSAYRDWNTATGEPNDGAGGPHEYYSSMWGPNAGAIATFGSSDPTGTWNDIPNSYTQPSGAIGFYAVAEVPVPEPTLIGALATGIALMWRGRRGNVTALTSASTK